MLKCKTCGEVFPGLYVPERSSMILRQLLQMQIPHIHAQENTQMNTLR